MFYEVVSMIDKSFSVTTHDVDVAILLAEFVSLTNKDIALLEYDNNNISECPSMGWLYNNGYTNTIGIATNVRLDE